MKSPHSSPASETISILTSMPPGTIRKLDLNGERAYLQTAVQAAELLKGARVHYRIYQQGKNIVVFCTPQNKP